MTEAATGLGPRTRAIIEGAHQLAQEHAVPYVGTEHLLIALTQVARIVTARVIAHLVDAEELVIRVDEALGELQAIGALRVLSLASEVEGSRRQQRQSRESPGKRPSPQCRDR